MQKCGLTSAWSDCTKYTRRQTRRFIMRVNAIEGPVMRDFHVAYPEYAATSRLDDLRATEYGYLDEGGHVYLDYTGAGLPARRQLREHAARIGSGAFGNPHSENPTSSLSTRLVEEARSAVLAFFGARRGDYAVIFTP